MERGCYASVWSPVTWSGGSVDAVCNYCMDSSTVVRYWLRTDNPTGAVENCTSPSSPSTAVNHCCSIGFNEAVMTSWGVQPLGLKLHLKR